MRANLHVIVSYQLGCGLQLSYAVDTTIYSHVTPFDHSTSQYPTPPPPLWSVQVEGLVAHVYDLREQVRQQATAAAEHVKAATAAAEAVAAREMAERRAAVLGAEVRRHAASVAVLSQQLDEANTCLTEVMQQRYEEATAGGQAGSPAAVTLKELEAMCRGLRLELVRHIQPPPLPPSPPHLQSFLNLTLPSAFGRSCYCAAQDTLTAQREVQVQGLTRQLDAFARENTALVTQVEEQASLLQKPNVDTQVTGACKPRLFHDASPLHSLSSSAAILLPTHCPLRHCPAYR